MTPALQKTAYRDPPSTTSEGDAAAAALSRLNDLSREFFPDLNICIYTDLAAIEDEWRSFEANADCTPFQTFEWLAAWQRHIGRRGGVIPAVAIARYVDGEIAVIMPLAVEPAAGRRLCWLGQELCDYNAPLLARDFIRRVSGDRFLALWREVTRRLQADPQLRFNRIEFEKMPQTVGVQPNPFLALGVIPNANSAHLTQLGADWDKFYRGRRSSGTRRRDRAKRKHMEEYGELRFVTVTERAELCQTLDTLWEQKKRIFARKGIADIFSRPGYREFFSEFAADPQSRHLAHISRIDIGGKCAAANFAITFGGCYYHVLSSYCDGQLARFGPGVLHLRELMAYAIGRGLRRFDFTIGDEQYKLEWSDLRLRLYDYSAAATLRGWPKSVLFTARRRIKRFIKQTPLIWRLVSRLRAAIGPLLHAERPKAKAKPSDDGPHASPVVKPAMACVMGSMDLLRPIAMAGIPCAVAAPAGMPSLYSRFAQARLASDPLASAKDRLEALVDFGRSLGGRPVLFYESDEDLLLISRHRERLAEAFRFVIADAPLIENLLDKGRFAGLALERGLPVPATVCFDPATSGPGDLGLDHPAVIKPVIRTAQWHAVFGPRKAIAAESPEALHRLWPQLREAGIALLAQRRIDGAEAQIESYHCYVDARGAIAGEFTGRKIRTRPAAYGHTTALEISDAEDVMRLGRDIVERIGLAGVAKLDFKRDAAGRLHLFEINPRFTLWHHAGAVAGVNIPALVYADLTGAPRPAVGRAKAGTRWCRAWQDLPAAYQSGMPPAAWLRWFAGCEAKSALAAADPMPLPRAALHLAAARLHGRHGPRPCE